MHVVHLGCDLWIAGNILKTLLLDTNIWGDTTDDERLLNAWLEFKLWARQNKWQFLNSDVLASLFFHCPVFDKMNTQDF